MSEASTGVVVAVALARFHVAGAPIESVEARVSVPTPVEGLAAGSEDGSAVSNTSHHSVLIKLTLVDECKRLKKMNRREFIAVHAQTGKSTVQ